MNEQNDKTPEQVSDEDYKVAPTSADKERLYKQRTPVDKKEQEQQEQATGENYQQLPTEADVKEELREGVE
ncbi:MAG TPA: hypothetical protein VJ729_05050 [Nitrososphaeraceae archaeon]|jgi:hypothetical protein|nr:hypothetical protein [Nitrososphaeraceae archaeon]